MPERRTTRETSSSQSAPPVPGSAASEFATVAVLSPGREGYGYVDRFLVRRAIERSIEGRAQLVALDDDDLDDDEDEDFDDDDDLDFDDDDLDDDDDDDDDDGDPLCPECDADLELGEEHEPGCSYGDQPDDAVDDPEGD